MDAVSPGAGEPAVAARRGPLRRFGAWYRRHVWTATALLIVAPSRGGLRGRPGSHRGQGRRRRDRRRRAPCRAWTRRRPRPACATQVAPRLDTVELAAGQETPSTHVARPAGDVARRRGHRARRLRGGAPRAAAGRERLAAGRLGRRGARREGRPDQLPEGARGAARAGGRRPLGTRASSSPPTAWRSCRPRTAARWTPWRSSARSSRAWRPGGPTPARCPPSWCPPR